MNELLGSCLLLIMVALMASRAAPPIAAKTTGSLVLDLPVRPIFRLLAHKLHVGAILVVLVLGSGLVGDRWISHGMFLFAIVAVLGLLAVPVHYQLTTTGVRPNRATFRLWSEFDGWDRAGNVIQLRGGDRYGSLKLYVALKDQPAVLKVVTQFVPAHNAGSASPRPLARASRRKLRQKGGVP